MAMYKAILLDISGVLYQGDTVIEGAVEAVERLRRSGVALRFITNTSRRPAAAVLENLKGKGFPVDDAELFTAPRAAHRWLKEQGRRPLLIVHPELAPDFDDIDQDNPDAVLLADAEEGLNYANLDRAFALLMDGAPLLAIGDNRYFHGGDRLHLDAGPFVRALEYAAGIEAHIAGKPSPLFFQQVLEDIDVSADQALMVGDDVAADVQGALDAGLHACLVKTGKYQPGDEDSLRGHYRVAESIAGLVDEILEGPRREA
jgi:HAD superfamily hydrolase (TIGR01458 family)